MKHKTKRTKVKAKSPTPQTRYSDANGSYNGDNVSSSVSFPDETRPKSMHEQWQVKPFVGRLFSTEVPEFEDNDQKHSKKHTKPSESKTTASRSEPKLSKVRHKETGKINIDRQCQSATNERHSWSTRQQHEAPVRLDAPRIIKHRPTLSVKVEADYFVPKMHRKTKSEPERREKISYKSNKAKQSVPVEPEGRIQLPMSVISESFQDRIYTPRLPSEELYSFGDIYEDNMHHYIHKYLEVDTFHRVAYVGPEHGSLAKQLEDYFCLTNPVQAVFPGKVDYKDIKEKSKLLAFKIAHVGAEEFFAQAAQDPQYKSAPYDRIIIHDAVQYFNDVKVTLNNVMKTLQEFGKLLIIHRPGSLNTLPYFNDAKERFADSDVPYMQIISALQKLGADVEWDLVHVPIVMPTSKWLAMLKAKFPAQMEIMSSYEIACGLRELSEGPLKYLIAEFKLETNIPKLVDLVREVEMATEHGDTMEIEDRLMFITASHATFDCAFPAVQRVGGASQVPYSGLADLQYKLELTKEMESFLPKSKAAQYKMKSLF